MTYEFLQQYWWFIVSLLGALLVFLLFVQGVEDLAVVGVQPIQLVAAQNARDDGGGGDRHERDGAECQELAVLVGCLVVALQLILDADAHDAALIDARLVGDDHARLEDGGVAAVQGVGAFVDVAHMADAVAGAAAVVDKVAPQRLTGDGVQHTAMLPVLAAPSFAAFVTS